MEEPFRQSLMFYLFRFMFLLCTLIHLHSRIKGILHSGNAPSMSGFTALIRIFLFGAVVQIWVIWINRLAWEPPVTTCSAASFFKNPFICFVASCMSHSSCRLPASRWLLTPHRQGTKKKAHAVLLTASQRCDTGLSAAASTTMGPNVGLPPEETDRLVRIDEGFDVWRCYELGGQVQCELTNSQSHDLTL